MSKKNSGQAGQEQSTKPYRISERAARGIIYGILGLGSIGGAVAGAKANVWVAGVHGREHERDAEAADRCAGLVSARGTRIVLRYSDLTSQQAEDCGFVSRTTSQPSEVPSGVYEGPVLTVGRIELPSVQYERGLAVEARAEIGGVGIAEGVASAVAGAAIGACATAGLLIGISIARNREV